MFKAMKPMTLWQIVLSVFSAFFGVQNNKAHHRDFNQGNITLFIITALFMTLLLIITIILVVNWVLPD